MESLWTSVGFDTWRYRVTAGDVGIDHDLTQLAAVTGAPVPPTTTTTAPPEPPTDPDATDPSEPDDPVGDAADRDASTSPRFTG
jgi:hypothetical protein